MFEEEYAKAEAIIKKAGFEHYGLLDVSTMELRQEVRDMCAQNTCGKYGASWACPPGCGSLDESRRIASKFKWGVLVQTVGELEDSLDFEGLMEAENKHKERFTNILEELRGAYPDLLPLSAGTCTLCAKCTYPDKPCRMPEKKMFSVEAFGLVVSDLCKANGIDYYYGPNTIAYTSAYLLG